MANSKEDFHSGYFPLSFDSIRKIGSKGWNFFDDPQDIDNLEVADVLNMVFDKGYPIPRKGSFLKWEKPDGETNDPLNTFAVRASDGTNYVIVVYAPNFYLRDEVNDQWILLNHTYTPSVTYKALPYDYANWDAGIGSDALYCGNGREDTIKWPIALGYLASGVTGIATTLTLRDASKFPSSGTLVIKDANANPFTVAYSSKSGNVLTLSAATGTAAGAGAAVTTEIQDKASMQKGSIFQKFQGRLVLANQYGGESSIFYSKSGDAENFTPASNPNDPGAEVVTDGNGGITGIDNFGEYLLIEKEDSVYKLTFIISSDVSAKLVQIVPVISDLSMGPIVPQSRIKKNNGLFYPTATEGIFRITPDITGSQTSVTAIIASQKIKRFANSLSYTNARTTSIDQKILIACASQDVNDTVLVYDILRDAWGRFNNWSVKDWLIHNHTLYFLSRIDGDIYEAFEESNTDNNNPYETFFYTKRWDFGDASKPKTMNKIFVQGYITQPTTLFVDVMFNESGQLKTLTYQISGTGAYVSKPIPRALAMAVLGLPIMGASTADDLDEMAIFRVYLAIPPRYGFYNIQLKFYTNKAGVDWGVTGLGFDPLPEVKAPAELVINAG